jgi:hypothetical protein
MEEMVTKAMIVSVGGTTAPVVKSITDTVQEQKQIALLFNSCQFKAARDLTDGLQERSTKHKSMFRKLAAAIQGCQSWDLFRHREAADHFRKARIDDLVEWDDRHLQAFAAETKERMGFLDDLVRNGHR